MTGQPVRVIRSTRGSLTAASARSKDRAAPPPDAVLSVSFHRLFPCGAGGPLCLARADGAQGVAARGIAFLLRMSLRRRSDRARDGLPPAARADASLVGCGRAWLPHAVLHGLREKGVSLRECRAAGRCVLCTAWKLQRAGCLDRRPVLGGADLLRLQR